MSASRWYGTAGAAIAEWREQLITLSHSLHDEPEVAFAEQASAAKLAELMRSAGFKVTEGAGDLPTALTAVHGEGELTIGVCAEYDALPEIGHGCGHNIICAIAAGAAIGLRAAADRYGFRVKLIGTPAEESGGGKQLLLERGVFDDVTVAMMAHPGAIDTAGARDSTQACSRFAVTYRGHPAHAASAPWDGVNAADAAVVAQVAIGLLRQQVPPSSRVAGFIRHGGSVTNIIPELAVLDYEVRAPDADKLDALRQRVRDCFRAGALATGAEVSFQQAGPDYLELRNDPWLMAAYCAHLPDFGRIAVVLPPEFNTASTDMGNISHVVPSIHPMIGLRGATATAHTREFAVASRTVAADEAAIDGANLLARVGIDLARDAGRRAGYVALRGGRDTWR
ncbi:amidohydrolase [Actinoplanes lutulentus]|uniref:Peptidase M20 domain-containing protein 2 n=1 Tax=Actinoplanes lutulentus TaxID=1287878 RepID=A0A327ZBS7_9ACTN|nr:M20 family metallopeptidase [Actinoplanes lutulentus]MBB2941371.1 amidohydrolase [Actinoplanes lutulentus]RAK36863.1 amidohydrolase [Actinoplanes lutulentus]